MSSDAKAGLAVITMLLLSFGFGIVLGMAIDRKEAIEAGVAHWTIDEKTGEKQFEWIKPGESK